MHYRSLGNTGATVSEVGMGCNRLGQDYASDEHWVDLVRRAVDLGVTVFDSAEAYGWGRSEEMLGRALGNRDDVLEKVFGFEKATLGFYQAVQDMIGGNPVLTQVIEAEKSHITRVMKVMITGAKFRSLQDQWP